MRLNIFFHSWGHKVMRGSSEHRHIIDFIVEIVNPQKSETVLDPACGTAGFLDFVLQTHSLSKH